MTIKTPIKQKISNIDDLIQICRICCFLDPTLTVDYIKEHVSCYCSIRLLEEFTKNNIKIWISDKKLNEKQYHQFCLMLLKNILSNDGYEIFGIDHKKFINLSVSEFENISNLNNIFNDVDFVFSNKTKQQLLFCFYNNRIDILKQIANRVRKYDEFKFNLLNILIVPSLDALKICLDKSWASNWPRGFFLLFDKIVEKMIEVDEYKFHYLKVFRLIFLNKKNSIDNDNNLIDDCLATVIDNTPLEPCPNHKHYIIRFRSSNLNIISPGQFLMVDTLPYKQRIKNKDINTNQDFTSLNNDIALEQKSYLKRPFSIHRAYYKHFPLKAFNNLSLPPMLGDIIQIESPSSYEILYKIIENGKGTNELKKLKKGDQFFVFGPLGRVEEFLGLNKEGINEIHIIGGGVGIAPLMFFAESFKIYNLKIKVFLGLENLYNIRKNNSNYIQNDYLFIENFIKIGIDLNNIFVSYEKQEKNHELLTPIKDTNYYKGYVSDQYKCYIKANYDKNNRAMIIACGPTGLLEALNNISVEYNINMKVLLEKRMGCGFGVCMSCVCHTQQNGEKEYSRVCVDGPIFDAKEIVWNY